MNQFAPSRSRQSAESTAAATAALAASGAAAVVVPEVACCVSSMIDRGGSVESRRLFLARRTALEMLRDRGYSVPEPELARTLPEFRAWWATGKPGLERLAFSTTLASDTSNKVKSFFFFSFCGPFAHISSLCSQIFIR
jgi:DNA-directed RNA polymerase I, II, and III subunit RPABC1